MPHTFAFYQFKPEPTSRIVLNAEFRRKHKGHLYLYAVTDGTAIKFGSTWDIEARIKTMQTGNSRELHCIGLILAKKGTESRVHKSLFYQHIRGEWFEVSQRTMRLVDLYQSGNADALYDHLDGILSCWA